MSLKTLSVVSVLTALAACGNPEEQARAEAKREAEVEAAAQRAKEKARPVERIEVAVPQGQHLPCTQVMDPPAYTAALGEVEALTVREATGAMSDATVSCSLVRGGKRPDQK